MSRTCDRLGHEADSTGHCLWCWELIKETGDEE